MPDGKVFNVNVGFENITGYSAKELMGRSILETNFWIDKLEHTVAIKELLKKGNIQNVELKFRKKSGEIMTGLLSADIIIINNEKIILSSISDISERKRTEEHITHLAQHDALTDLPNRVLFEDRLKQAIALAGRNKELLALMYLDIDFFKQINDNFGHTVGDSVLMGVARRMLDSVRKSDTVARIGGDEFVVLLQEIKEGNEALFIAEQIRLALNRPFELAGHFISTSPSIGLVLYPEHGADELQLIRNADIAMYKAKESGRNNVKMFKESYKN
jgi:diguanylate cyclase (GGDEF)-like protein/PAS domain S-box-containing protein